MTGLFSFIRKEKSKMITTICLGWIGYQLSAPLWYFVLVAIRLFFDGYNLCNALYKAANKKG